MSKIEFSPLKFLVILISFFGLSFSSVFAASYHTVSSGGSDTITEYSPSVFLTNSCANGIFIPTNSLGEWNSFKSYRPGCVVFKCLMADGTSVVSGNGVSGWNYDSAYAASGQTCTSGTYTCTSDGSWSPAAVPSNYCDQYSVWISGGPADTCNGDYNNGYICTATENKTCVDTVLSGYDPCMYSDSCGNCSGGYTVSQYRNITCRGSASAGCVAQGKTVNGHSYNLPAMSHGQTTTYTSSAVATTVTCGGNTVSYNQSFTCTNGIVSLNGGEGANTASCGAYYSPSGTTCVASTTTTSCGGSIPANAYASTASTYSQTWSCGSWLPTRAWSQGAASCGFQCNSGYGWNGTSCAATAINGVCDNANFGCASGTFVDDTGCVGSYYKWHCNGVNGGTSLLCAQADSSCSSCFPAGTKVTLADGTKQNIETITEGQKIESYNETTGENYASSVTKAIHHKTKTQIIYTFVLSDGKVIEPNSIHPIYEAISGKYFKTNEIYQKYLAGEPLELQEITGERVTINYINPSIRVIPVYNLHVNGIDTQTDDSYGIGHNYYVNDILVHNKVVNPYSCFVAGTKVTMADGTEKNIEDVQVGEKVVIYDELIGAKFTSPVTMTLHHPSASQDIYTITLDDGTVLKPNQDHPLYEAGTKTYVTTPAFADAFHNGKNPLLQKLDGSIHSVSTITKKGMSVPTYNLHVAGIDNNPNMVSVAGIGHNYYANGILVHNNMITGLFYDTTNAMQAPTN